MLKSGPIGSFSEFLRSAQICFLIHSCPSQVLTLAVLGRENRQPHDGDGPAPLGKLVDELF
jgi:hypothetical protein